jgi:hypothetical protein
MRCTPPPITWLRDADRVEAILVELYNTLIEALCEKYVHPQGVTTQEALDYIGDLKSETRPLVELWQAYQDIAEQPYIDVQPHHRQKDIQSAFRLIRGEQGEGPPPGQKKRDELTAVQCAILHVRYGWSYESIAEKYGWSPGSNVVSKYIRDGRRLLEPT